MTDKEVFEKFMGWIGMEPSKTKEIKNKTAIEYKDTETCEERFTKLGYDEFYAGAIFDENGKIVKAYIDSHVAVGSKNYDDILELMSKKE